MSWVTEYFKGCSSLKKSYEGCRCWEKKQGPLIIHRWIDFFGLKWEIQIDCVYMALFLSCDHLKRFYITYHISPFAHAHWKHFLACKAFYIEIELRSHCGLRCLARRLMCGMVKSEIQSSAFRLQDDCSTSWVCTYFFNDIFFYIFIQMICSRKSPFFCTVLKVMVDQMVQNTYMCLCTFHCLNTKFEILHSKSHFEKCKISFCGED